MLKVKAHDRPAKDRGQQRQCSLWKIRHWKPHANWDQVANISSLEYKAVGPQPLLLPLPDISMQAADNHRHYPRPGAEGFSPEGLADGRQQRVYESTATDIVTSLWPPQRRALKAARNLDHWRAQFARLHQSHPLCVTFDIDEAMAENFQPTQQATQPVDDPRRLGKHLSDISGNDAADVICLLHAQTLGSQNAVQATMLYGRQHILQNEDLEGLKEDDLILPQFQETRELALRMSSGVKSPKDGFVFGRNPTQCDVLLTTNTAEKLVSNRHFKIYVNSHGSLMLQDLSTNGTLVDSELLKSKAREGMRKPATRALNNGSIISLISTPNKAEIKFLVRIPNRQDQDDLYEHNMRRYLEARGTHPQFASMRESSYGNFWNGGSDYNFTGNLGKGAFATVYRVQTKREGHLYAAKEIDKRRFIKNGILDIKFDNELKIMQSLKHPNIVEYVDCKSHEHWIYIIMEFVSHGELSQELRARGLLPEPEVQQITRQMMHALRYLHRRGITHRDIKPDNILIASRSPLIVKLSDFGLSKCVSDQETFLKTFCGTLLYCAPEVYPEYGTYAQGMQPKRRRSGEPSPKPSPYDDSVDMWSFGAVIFHLLAGKAPVAGRGDDRGAQMLSNIMTKDIDFAPLRDQKISENGIDFIAQLLNRNPLRRPNESVCLDHAWLRDVPDLVDYPDAGPSPDQCRRALEAVEELDEDAIDTEMVEALEQLTQPPVRLDYADSQSPLRPKKKRRTSDDSDGGVREIIYPALPAFDASSSYRVAPPPPPAGRLFGEIDPDMDGAAAKSSGLFGDELLPTIAPRVPDIRHGVEQISVNDFQSMDEGPEIGPADVSGQPLIYPQTLDVPHDHPNGSAPSLLGAEAQIGELRVRTPPDEGSAVTTPETANNPVTPQTRELSPSSSISKSVDSERRASQRSQLGHFNRTVDLNLINDEAAYAAEIAARDASRMEMKQKAETFQAPETTRRLPSVELARTIDAFTGQEVRLEPLLERNGNVQERMIQIDTPPTSGDFVRPARRFGKLISTADSYVNINIPLEQRDTFWGRDRTCNKQYPDPQDTRIPKWALKVWFWAEGLDGFVRTGGDWTTYPGIYTIIATSASKGILVNGVKLMQRDGECGLYGKLYRGDEITIYEQPGDPNVLKFTVEILFGAGATSRPESERPFKILKEQKQSKEYFKQMSFRQSMIGTHVPPSSDRKAETAWNPNDPQVVADDKKVIEGPTVPIAAGENDAWDPAKDQSGD